VLVLGTGAEARVVEASLNDADYAGMQVVGFYALEKVQETVVSPNRVLAKVRPPSRIWSSALAFAKSSLPCGSSAERIAAAGSARMQAERHSGHGPCPVLRTRPRTGTHRVAKGKLADLRERVSAEWLRRVVKRAFDVTVAMALLAVFFPLMAMVAILIFLERRGPVIYRQERVGLRGDHFVVLKFRSMRADAKSDGKPRWARARRPARDFIRADTATRQNRRIAPAVERSQGRNEFRRTPPWRPQFVTMLTDQVPFTRFATA
jgi:hypothetical protein